MSTFKKYRRTNREQLEELKDNILSREFDAIHVPNAEKLLEQLIAERPYEPGETILVRPPGNTMEMVPAIFISVSPDDNTIVLANRLGGDSPQYFHDHRPIPKTRRLKPVPVEVIDKARQITASRIDDVVAANEVCNWLANPENWEADNE